MPFGIPGARKIWLQLTKGSMWYEEMAKKIFMPPFHTCSSSLHRYPFVDVMNRIQESLVQYFVLTTIFWSREEERSWVGQMNFTTEWGIWIESSHICNTSAHAKLMSMTLSAQHLFVIRCHSLIMPTLFWNDAKRPSVYAEPRCNLSSVYSDLPSSYWFCFEPWDESRTLESTPGPIFLPPGLK